MEGSENVQPLLQKQSLPGTISSRKQKLVQTGIFCISYMLTVVRPGWSTFRKLYKLLLLTGCDRGVARTNFAGSKGRLRNLNGDNIIVIPICHHWSNCWLLDRCVK